MIRVRLCASVALLGLIVGGWSAADDRPPPPPKTAEKKGPAYLAADAKHDGKTLAEWTAALADKDDFARDQAAASVARFGPNAKAAVPALLPLLKNPADLCFTSALKAISAIGPAATEAVEPLVALLRHKDATVRVLAAGTLSDLGPAAGKAVQPLIAALNDPKVGTEADRDSMRYSLRQVGKYDIRAVYAAVRRDKLTDADLSAIVETLGPDDVQAVDGLVAELKGRDADPVARNWDIYTMAGLKRIGPKAAPALPELRALLKDKSKEVRESAAEAIKAIDTGSTDTPKGDAPKKGEQPEDLRKVLAAAGFDSLLHIDVGWYVRVGSKEAFKKYAPAKRDEKAEMDKAAAGHREDVRKRSFRLGKLEAVPVNGRDVDGGELVLMVFLPLRVRGEKPIFEDADAFTGVLSRMHPSEILDGDFRFLTKDGTLRACTPAEAAVVKRNNGVLYVREAAHTTLYITVNDKVDVLKRMVENRKDYMVEIDISELHLGRPLAWGYFRTDAYADAKRDCQKLWLDYLADDKNPQPVYFPIALGKENAEKIPELVRARLDALRLLDKDGKVVGGYKVK